MNILFLGDIVGRGGRMAVIEAVPDLRRRLKLDFVVANGENAAGGFGITRAICEDLFAAGVDVLTSGNHIWDQREALDFIDDEDRLLRPMNFAKHVPGKGFGLFTTSGGAQILVVNVMCQLFMPPIDDPFAPVDDLLDMYPLGYKADAILIDVHGEATSEKVAMGHLADGRASFVVGTHTHIPTADAHVLSGGTGYQTEAGMCGDYDSVIGMDKHMSLSRFVTKLPAGRLSPAMGAATVCGTFVETNKSGLAVRVEPLRLGGVLSENIPEV